VARLAAVLLAGVAQPEVMARFRQVGAEPWPLATAAYNAFMAAEVARWAPVVRASGATVD
jgi:tripartite-type tricarboxylate transporter receptor subunit TctC